MKALRLLVLTLSAAMMPFSVLAAPGDGIQGTAHDFSGILAAGATTGLCTVCHTPHKAQTQALLWNHTLSVQNFSWTDPVTTAGTPYVSFAGDTYNGPTARCLSCHDGSVAVGDVGWWAATGPLVIAGLPAIGDPTFQIGAGGGNLDGNHPVAMPIPFNNVANTYNGSTTGAGITLADWKADPSTLGIGLYNDDGAGNISRGGVAGQTGIECGSCHDPHNGSAVEDIFFLRGLMGTNAANYICIKCHTKE
jgi:hypothetical protein